MEGKIVGLFLIALIGGLAGGFGLSYIIYQPQVQNLLNTTNTLQNQVQNLQSTANNLQNQVANLNSTLQGLLNMTGAGINNQVQVSGTVYGKQTGTIYFRTANESIRTSSPITDGKYSVMLVGGQSYDIYIDYYHTSSYVAPDFVLYVPLGVTVFTANF